MTLTKTKIDWFDFISLTNNVDLIFQAKPSFLCNTQVRDYLTSISSFDAIEEIVESFNGWGYYTIEPYEIGALTSSQIITDYIHVWWFPCYETICPIQEILTYGKFTFTYGGTLD